MKQEVDPSIRSNITKKLRGKSKQVHTKPISKRKLLASTMSSYRSCDLKVSILYKDPFQSERVLKWDLKRRETQIVLPFRHGGNGFKRLNQTTIGIGVTILPPSERRRQEITGGTIGFGNDSGESTIGEKRIGGTTDTIGIAVGRLISEGTPLRGLINGVRFQYKTTLGAKGVSG